MIDAYEIGIQLALQDGVSAGLETIGRELAEVDRAIAATTAGLQGLTLAAQAAKEVAAVAGIRLQPTTAGASSVGEEAQQTVLGERVVQRAVSQGRLTDPQVSASETARVQQSPAMPVSQSETNAAAPIEKEFAVQLVPETPTVDKSSTAPAPAMPVLSRVLTVEPSANSSNGGDAGQVSPEPSAAPLPTADTQARTPVLDQARPDTAFSAPMRYGDQEQVITASVSKLMRSSDGTVPTSSSTLNRAGYRDLTGTQVPAQEFSAASSGQPTSNRMPGSTAGLERAVAPQPQVSAGDASMSGTVMLDGRMVGIWMSDHMAREASRPPGGTTFFDPRQSPAWNASGAL